MAVHLQTLSKCIISVHVDFFLQIEHGQVQLYDQFVLDTQDGKQLM
jgi:hypothetical protein